jgi:arylsulfate sulfotransferase
MKTGSLLSVLGLWLSCGMVLTGGCASSQAPPPPITISISPQAAAVGTGQSTQFRVTTNDTAGVTWSATSGTIDASGYYAAPSGALSATVTVTATSKKDPTKSASATVNVVAPGTVAATANVQVAQYTIAPAGAGDVSVQFGQDTSYGLTTWMQPVPQGGGVVSLFVAGMKANTLYHLRGVVRFGDGSQFLDADKTFTTQSLPATQLPTITATTTAGMAPQSGVEMLDLVYEPSTVVPVAVTDLDGNVLWSYNPGLSGVTPNPIKLLPNGHFLINFSGPTVDGANSVLQEVDLNGTLIWQMTAADLNNALVASCASTGIGCNLTVTGTHHDFMPLPSGHLIVIAGTQQSISGTTVTGDVIIDLDQNHKPVWLWNEFDHLDINRQPYLYPDWTHTNAVIYSPDDGNLIISMRHQNWLVKVGYANGKGLGDILWKLGYQGDFALMNADGTLDSNPADWFFAQHGPSFVSTNTTGKFSLTVFDNGDDRGVTVVTGGTCGVTGQPACFSTVPILGLDETAKTATLSFHPTTPEYSLFGGNAEVLKNGNVEYCETAGGPSTAGDIYEVTQGISAQTVWKMVTGGFAYRGQRIPSFYPGVQW